MASTAKKASGRSRVRDIAAVTALSSAIVVFGAYLAKEIWKKDIPPPVQGSLTTIVAAIGTGAKNAGAVAWDLAKVVLPRIRYIPK